MRKIILTLLSIGASQSAHSTLYFSTVNWDGYADGKLAGQHGWTENALGRTEDIQIQDGKAVWGDNTKFAYKDVGKTIGAGESLFYSMKVTVTGDNDTHTFAGFVANNTINYSAQTGVDLIGPNDYRIGVSNITAIEEGWATGQFYGQEYLVVAGYNFDTGVSTLWVDPTSSSSTSITTAANVGRDLNEFLFRTTNNGSLNAYSVSALSIADTFDEAFVAVTVPEPSSTSLLGLGGLALLLRRRKQS